MWNILLEYLFTPCPRYLRKMGYLAEVGGIRRRFQRVGHEWQHHIERCHDVITEGVGRCQQFRKAVIFGAGLIHDVPLKMLAQKFQQVLLVDVVHPLSSRWVVRQFPNVRRVNHDVTNSLKGIYRVATRPNQIIPVDQPQWLLDDKELDYTVSLNLLSQLPCMPMDYLRKWHCHTKAELEEMAKQLIKDHLEYLSALPGCVSLITDYERTKYNLLNQVVEKRDLFFGLKLPRFGPTWEWRLAPCPEADRKHHYFRQVVGIADWK
ncbi:MAG: hypothetical protein R3B84_20715 [Zavarzinella sp.]